MENIILRTERLLLRPFELSDATDVQRLAGQKEIADTTLMIPHPYEDGVAEEWIKTHASRIEERKSAIFAITIKDSGELIGAIDLTIHKTHNRAEMGYWIGVPYWNKGYCTEVAQAVLNYGFSKLDLNRIYAYHLVRNPASGKVMEKIGMKREAMLIQHVKKNGVYEDIIGYGVISDEK